MNPKNLQALGGKYLNYVKAFGTPKSCVNIRCCSCHSGLLSRQDKKAAVHSMSFPPWLTAVVGSGGAGGGLLPLPPLPFPLLLLESPGSGQGEVALKEEGQTFC